MLLQDFDGVIGMFSGKELPSNLTTDTGLIKLRFTSDASLDVSLHSPAAVERLVVGLETSEQAAFS